MNIHNYLPETITCPDKIESKKELEEFYWFTGTREELKDQSIFLSLLTNKVKYNLVMTEIGKPNEYWYYEIKFPRCKYSAKAHFCNYELYKITV